VTGWNPAFCIEAIVRDIMVNMTGATPPARLDPTAWERAYTLPEAVEAYRRVAAAHGWAVPEDFDKVNGVPGDRG
jgi:ubiquitin-conjugating enzyme E2 Q